MVSVRPGASWVNATGPPGTALKRICVSFNAVPVLTAEKTRSLSVPANVTVAVATSVAEPSAIKGESPASTVPLPSLAMSVGSRVAAKSAP